MRPTGLILTAGLVSLTLGIGCATSSPSPSAATSPDGAEKRPKLYRTQVGNEVSLQWQSEPGTVYGVIYSPDISDTRSWRLLSGYDHILGNGGQQQVTFTAPVSGKAYYRLRESPAR